MRFEATIFEFWVRMMRDAMMLGMLGMPNLGVMLQVCTGPETRASGTTPSGYVHVQR